MATPEIIARLRRATSDAHARLETTLDIVTRLSDPAGRRSVAARFLTLHESVEAKLAPWTRARPELDAVTRPRADLIRADLIALGGTRSAPSPASPEIDSLGRALGWFYVLEGSTLGGKVIHRELERRDVDPRGLGFLNPYGEQAGPRWRGFVDVLDRLHRDGAADGDEIVAGGVDGFDHAARVLCGAST